MYTIGTELSNFDKAILKMKRSPLKNIAPKIGLVANSRVPKNEMRFVDMINGALVLGSFAAFSLFSWYMVLKWLQIF